MSPPPSTRLVDHRVWGVGRRCWGDESAGEEGLIEVEFGAVRVRVGRRAEVGVALAVIGALQGRR
jgi:hypothetical protein